MKLKSGKTLTPLQKKIYKSAMLDSPYTYIVVCTGRQVAKTTTDILIALTWCQTSKFRVGFFMPVYSQCKKVFKQLTNMLKNSPKGLIKNISDLYIEFPNGSSIKFFTSENDNCRGNTFDGIIVDEACFVKDEIYQQAITATISVALTRGYGKVVLTSTPKKKNWFYNMFNLPSENKICIKATSEEGGLISKDVLEDIKKYTPDHIYRNEYLAEFQGEGEGIFEYKKCISNNIINTERCVAGLDFGMDNDYTVLTILNGLGELVFIKRWHQINWMDCINEIANILKKYNAICFAETNGIGNMPFQTLANKYPNTISWITSAKSKTDIINKLSADFKAELIKIPNIDYLLLELDAFTMEYDPSTGRISYGARQGFNDDCVMSLAIANFNRMANSPIFTNTKKRY